METYTPSDVRDPLQRALATPPQAPDLERACLYACLFSSAATDAVLDLLADEDFYDRKHRKVIAAIRALRNRDEGVDETTVAEELRSRRDLESIGGIAFLTGISADTPAVAAHAEWYAAQVAERAHLRRLIELSEGTIRECYQPDADPEEVQAQLDAKLGAVSPAGRKAKSATIRELLPDVLEFWAQQPDGLPGVPSGLPALDKLTGGWRPERLITVAARPSVGKSALCLEFVRGAAAAGVPTLLFSLEMTTEECLARIVAAESGMDVTTLDQQQLTAELASSVYEAGDVLREWPLRICAEGEMTVAAIRAHAREVQRRHGLGLIVIDQLQMIQRPERSENENVAYTRIVYALKALAKALSVPVILQCQLSRDVEKREDKRPMLSDLRDTGSIEQASDLVLMLYRESMHRKGQQQGPPMGLDPTEVLIRKQRQGARGMVQLGFDLQRQRFHELDRRHDEQEAPPERTYSEARFDDGW